MANVGYATLQIIPSVRGIGDELRRQLVGPAGDAGDDAGEAAGGGFGDTFKGALAAIGVAEIASRLGEQFTEAFADALEQGHVKKVLVAQLGSAGGAAARQGDAVGALFAKGVTDNFEQGAEAVRQAVSGGLIPPDATLKQIELIGTRMTDVANVFGTDMALQSKAVSAMLKNGVAKSADEALDVITTGFQLLGPNAEDLLETFQEYSVQFRKLGIDAPTALSLFSAGLENGARDTDILADAMKEFSIRSIDMSEGSREAYKAMGLNAEAMEAQIGRGGDAARLGLAKVLDSLRAIHDPVKREAAAVGLFGTQAEDLGKALFALHPEITGGLEGTAGAAQRLGETLRSGPNYELKVFARTIKQGLVDFLGGQVIPLLGEWGHVFATEVMPPLSAVGSVLAATVMPVLVGFGVLVAGTVGWLREWGVWLIPLGIAIGGVTLAMNLQAIATGAVTAVFAIYRGVILAGTAVTNGFAAAQGLLTAVMNANPIVLVITAIVALGAALVIAYQKSETFRGIVQATWTGIKAGWDALWNGALKPGFDGLMVGLRAIGAGSVWLWNAMQPVFSAIGLGARVLAAVIAVILVAPILLAFDALGTAAGWLWTNAIKPSFEAIGAAAVWFWTVRVKPVFDNVVALFRAVGAISTWLWTGAIKPAFEAIGAGAAWLWNSAVKPVFSAFGAGAGILWRNAVKPAFDGIALLFRALGATSTWLWNSAVKPAFNWIADKSTWLYEKGMKPGFDAVTRGVHLVGAAFGLAKDAIGKAWNQVTDITKKPVNFILEWVYQKGIKKVWDGVAGFVGLDPLPAAPKLLARGGRTSGGIPGKDSIPALLMADEFVVKRSSARKIGFGALEHINRTGELPAVQRFADGGVVDWFKGAASKVGGAVMSGVDFLSDPGKMWDKATQFIRDKVREIGSSSWAQALGRMPGKMLDGLKDKILGATRGLFGGSGGPPGDIGGSGVQRWSSVVLQALRMVGQPASLLPVVLRRMNQESGGNPAAINNWDINAKNGTPSKGLMQVIDPTFNAHAGALRGRGVWDPLANIYASMRYAMSRYGSLTSAYNRPGGYAGGGRPRAGEVAWVGERGPELVRFGSGRTEVFDHATSMRMAGGLGALRGFAKGTRSARRAGPPTLLSGDLGAFTQSLTGSASAIGAAAAQLAKDLKAAGGAGVRLAAQTAKVNAQIQALGARRDALSSLIATARAAAADQTKTAGDFLGLSNLSGATSIGDVLTGMEGRQKTLRDFQSQIGTLSKKGLSQDLIRQLVSMGPDSALAGILAGGSAGDIRRLNTLAKNGGTLAGSFGNSMADAMYDSGRNASKGFLTGLLSQQADLQASMTRLGAELAHSVRTGMRLGPASPLVLNSSASRAAAAAGTSAVGRKQAAPAARPAATAAAVGRQPVRLVVGGREMDAYMEEVADGRVAAYDQTQAMRATAGRK